MDTWIPPRLDLLLPPANPPLQIIPEPWAQLPVRFPLNSRSPPAISHTAVCKRQSSSPSLSHPPLTLSCPHVSSLHLHLCSFPGNRFTCIIFLDSTYMWQYLIFAFSFFSLSGKLLENAVNSFPYLFNGNNNVFFSDRVVRLYIRQSPQMYTMINVWGRIGHQADWLWSPGA